MSRGHDQTHRIHHVVVIGGGYAGTLAANHLPARADVNVTLVNSRQMFVEQIRLSPARRQ